MTTNAIGTVGMNPTLSVSYTRSANVTNIASSNVINFETAIVNTVTGASGLTTVGNITTYPDNPGMISAPPILISNKQLNALESAAANTATLQNAETTLIVVDAAVLEFNTLEQSQLKAIIPPQPNTSFIPD
jgi:hypothetical protein